MYTVTITSQGQISIPAKLRRKLGLDKVRKAIVSEEKSKIVIEPMKDILELRGSFKTSKKFSPRVIRKAFETYLAREAEKGIPKSTLKKLGFRQVAPNIFAPPKISPVHTKS